MLREQTESISNGVNKMKHSSFKESKTKQVNLC